MPTPAKPVRRTQAERRATTRAALLDAVIELLVQDGYASLTTRRIAARAGVSQGTLQHYFRTKSEFVLEAMGHAVEQVAADALRRIDLRALEDPGRQEAVLDEIWRVHQSPAFKAALELWVASRSDTDLRRNLRRLERDITGTIRESARSALREPPADPELVNIVLAAVRGIAMLAPVVPQAELERRWRTTKARLLAIWRDQLARA